MLSFTIPKQIVAEGIRVSMESSSTVDKVPLGPEFYKVFVESVRKPNALLERPNHGVKWLEKWLIDMLLGDLVMYVTTFCYFIYLHFNFVLHNKMFFVFHFIF